MSVCALQDDQQLRSHDFDAAASLRGTSETRRARAHAYGSWPQRPDFASRSISGCSGKMSASTIRRFTFEGLGRVVRWEYRKAGLHRHLCRCTLCSHSSCKPRRTQHPTRSRPIGVSFLQVQRQPAAYREHVGPRSSTASGSCGRSGERRRPASFWLSQTATQSCFLPCALEDRSEDGAGTASSLGCEDDPSTLRPQR